MFDATGLKADGIKNKIIRDDMISDNANINGEKLNISSVVTSINNGTTTIKGSKIYLDEKSQTLNVAFNSMSNTVNDHTSTIGSHTTSIGVMQGQITGLISDTTIVEDGTSKKIKDVYTSLKATVNGISSKVSSVESSFNNLQIGARNLFVGGKFKAYTSYNTIQSQRGSEEIVCKWNPTYTGNTFVLSNNDFKPSGTYTISGYITINDEIPKEKYFTGLISTSGGEYDLLSNKYDNVTGYFEITQTYTGKTTWIIHGRTTRPNGSSDIVKLTKLKLEKGTKATDWSPAHEDVDSSINAVDTKVTALDVTVKSTSSKVSAIEQNMESITQRVSSTETKVTTITNTANTANSNATNALNTANSATNLAKAMNNGKILHTDPNFRKGLNGVVRYANSNQANVTITRIAKPSDCPSTSTHCIEIKHTGTASPGYGGFHQNIQSRANAVFLQKIVAKIPVGYSIYVATNAIGTGYKDRWLTPNKGTGNWEEYIREVRCGSTGTFNNSGFVYINGSPTPTTDKPLIWYLAYCTAIDITDNDESVNNLTTEISSTKSKVATIETNLNGITQRVSTIEQNQTTVDGKVTSLETWKKSAEQKITDASIISTVSSQFYKKGETDNMYAKQSTVTQLDDKFEFEIYESTSPNLMPNSSFEKEEVYTRNHPFILDWTTGGDGNYPSTIDGGKAILLYTNGGDSYFVKDTAIKIEKNTKYTISFYYCCTHGRLGSNYIFINGNPVNIPITYIGDRAWHRHEFTFITTDNVDGITAIRFGIVAQETCWILFDNVQIEKGERASRYRYKQNEVCNGVSFIDHEGMGVKHEDGSYTKMLSNGFKRYIGSTGYSYHYLTYIGKTQKLDFNPITIQLPDDFKGKNFNVTLSLEEIANPAGWMVQSFQILVKNINIANATFEIHGGSQSQFHDGTEGQMRPTTISYTVTA